MKLQPLRFIAGFHVDLAEYHLYSAENVPAKLRVDYAGNTYAIESESNNQHFLEEIGKVARGLLARKHAVTLAQKDHYLV